MADTLIETAAATCLCGKRFRYLPAFYIEHGLQFPRRCRACRDARGSTPAPREVGTVRTVFQRGFAFITPTSGGGALPDGRDVYVHKSDCAVGAWPLAVGARVTFERVPDAATRGKNPQGRAVALAPASTPDTATEAATP